MSKLTKFITNPKRFFIDSPWLKKNKINLNNKYKNVFIVSHLGQLNQAESLIEYEQIENCLLVILYTNKNTKVPKSIQNQYNKNLFDDSILFLLPNYPNNYNTKSLVFMKRNYQELIDITKPDNLYLLSFENHYSLLATYATKQNTNLCLIDEGTATYKSRTLSEYYKTQNIFKNITAKILGVDAAFDWFTDFKKVYAAFPELLKSTFKANSYNRFFAHAGKFNIDKNTSKLITDYNITSNDFLYVNQRYAINNDDFVNSILLILGKISQHYNSKVFIKMHPKDHISLINSFNAVIKSDESFNNIILIKENEFLIEPAIEIINPKGVIGLTSTSLVYTPLVSPNTKVYSIKPWFIKLIPPEYNQNGIDIINDHFKILQQFKHVISLDDEKQLETCVIDTSLSRLNNNYKTYLKIAREAFGENNYHKSIINYIWTYPQGIKSIPLDDFSKYLDAFYNEYGIKQSLSVVDEWIEAEILKQNESIGIHEYVVLIKVLTQIIQKECEYSNNLYADKLYDTLLSLLTSRLSIEAFSINAIDIEMILLKEYEVHVFPLLEIKSKRYIFEAKYKEAKYILNTIFSYEDYVSENENLYIYLIDCLTYLNEDEELSKLNLEVQEKIWRNEIKVLSESLIAIYQSNYAFALKLLTPEINNFTDTDRKNLKPELIMAKIHRLLENIEDARTCLILFETHSKGNIFCHREIAYLEYYRKNYKKVIYNFNVAYQKTIQMPIKDFEKYVESLYYENQYSDIYEILNRHKNLITQNISYYFLVSLYHLCHYEEYIIYNNELNSEIFNHQDKEALIKMEIKALRETGKIEKALQLIYKEKQENSTSEDLDFLLLKAEIYELTENFDEAHLVWKQIITEFSQDIPSSTWTRYYGTLGSRSLQENL